MRSSPRPPSHHRLIRLTAWLRLWLVWLTGLYVSCATHDERTRRRQLDHVAGVVGRLIFIHAAARCRQRAPRARRYVGGRIPPNYRAYIGGRVRRSMRAHGWRARLMAILAVMRDLETHVAALAQRLRHGLTRQCAIVPVCTPAAALCVASAAAVCADSL